MTISKKTSAAPLPKNQVYQHQPSDMSVPAGAWCTTPIATGTSSPTKSKGLRGNPNARKDLCSSNGVQKIRAIFSVILHQE
ncbi:hypothetical protein [Bifidobacterium breve]|uniref:hypothetical protein n=1 Tax=Bifidobacterium breve TaxID=1685 RepID=UPI00374FA7A5